MVSENPGVTPVNPRVTVLMPVYNGEKYVAEAIESILQQTFTDFEFLIINDGSRDDSERIIRSYRDDRILLINNETNLKLIATLNKGLELARGEYIARMDCDDISLPNRLAKQVDFMETHPEVGVCGTWVETIGLKSGELWRYPSTPEEIAAGLFFRTALAHPTVMLRNSFLRKNNLKYNSEYIHAEDFALWRECSRLFSLANIPQVLLKYRIVPNSITRAHWTEMQKTLGLIFEKNLAELKMEHTDQTLLLCQRISSLELDSDENSLKEAEKFLSLIIGQNNLLNVYPEPYFAQAAAYFWYLNCNAAASLGFRAWKLFWNSPLSRRRAFTKLEKVKFFTKCLIKRKGKERPK